jgi:hypothetical protein
MLELYESPVNVAVGHNTWSPVKIKITGIYQCLSSKIWSVIGFDIDIFPIYSTYIYIFFFGNYLK